MGSEQDGVAEFRDLEAESSGSNVVGGNEVSMAAQRSPERTLPLAESVVEALPECTDPDIPECARETIQYCIVELMDEVVERAVEHCRSDQRLVISAEDMQRAVDSFNIGEHDDTKEEPEAEISCTEADETAAGDVQPSTAPGDVNEKMDE